MKFYLVKNVEYDDDSYFTQIDPEELNPIMLAEYDAALQENISLGERDEVETRLFEKFKKAFDTKYPDGREWLMRFGFKPPCNLFDWKNWGIFLQSEILQAVQQVLGQGHQGTPLEIEVEMECREDGQEPNHNDALAKINAKGFFPGVQENGELSHTVYRNESIEGLFGRPSFPTGIWYVSVAVVGPEFICLEDILPLSMDANRKIWTDKKYCDFEIVSEDGAAFPCHKIFLDAKSPVFAQMLEGKFEEARNNRMTLDDMSTRGVNALLEYLYCDDVREALAHCDVAFELLKAADKYDLPILWNAVATILTKRSAAWFDVDVALKLFNFVVYCSQREESDGLKNKLHLVLTKKSEELASPPALSELWPQASQKFFKLSAEAVNIEGGVVEGH